MGILGLKCFHVALHKYKSSWRSPKIGPLSDGKCAKVGKLFLAGPLLATLHFNSFLFVGSVLPIMWPFLGHGNS